MASSSPSEPSTTPYSLRGAVKAALVLEPPFIDLPREDREARLDRVEKTIRLYAEEVRSSPVNTGNIVYRNEEWVPLAAYQEAMEGWKAANAATRSTDGINYQAWATNMIAFIRERDLEVQFRDWSGGWPCPVSGQRADLRTIERAEWLRLSKVECAARDARDAVLGVVDNHKELGASTKLVLEKTAEELRIAVNGDAVGSAES
jgi:hypothetical protein